MATSARIIGSVGLLSFLLAVGCSSSSAPININPNPAGSGSGNSPSGVGSSPSSSASGNGGGTGSGLVKAIDLGVTDNAQLKESCGNSQHDEKEQCDDGNKESDDGCTELCQVVVEYECPEVGPCRSLVACGDGILATTEICDDKNTDDGDGCKGDCSAVEDGWQCRVPGRDCIPLCGDEVLTGSEKCDDGNADSGDGCSSTCQVEKGYDCGTDLPSKCTTSECGNNVQEAGEGCDLGEENGLFYGVAGQGCSKTCTKEPDCRPDGKTQACSAACGDANLDKYAGEECDDANAVDGDGCSADCKLEAGFNCEDETKPDTVDCPSDGSQTCLVLPIIYRDFDGANVSGGHPDFFYMGENGPDGKKTVCVPNASGKTATVSSTCSNTDATDLCKELVKPDLGADGKPQLNTSRSDGLKCACRFTDWDTTGIIDGSSPTTCKDDGDNLRNRIGYDSKLMVQVIKDENSFKQWYNDSDKATTVKGMIELASIGSNQFQFSSSTEGADAGADPLTVYDDIHAIFMGKQTTLTSGFFPLEDTNRGKVCNIWPYWHEELQSASGCVAKDGGVVVSQWDPEGSYTAKQEGDGGPVAPVKGLLRNFYFTSEVRYLFRFDAKAGGGTLKFFGDDDVWVFINGKLAIDLGAPHERLTGSVSVTAKEFGLEDGRIYEIVVYHADRHPRESNYQLTVSGFSTTRTLCESACGNGVRTAGEECDDGDDNKEEADAYNACTKECRYGPFCGDGDINGDEECDNGQENGQPYGTPDGCTTACTKVHFCGDGFIDGAFGEVCDGGAGCDDKCLPIVKII